MMNYEELFEALSASEKELTETVKAAANQTKALIKKYRSREYHRTSQNSKYIFRTLQPDCRNSAGGFKSLLSPVVPCTFHKEDAEACLSALQLRIKPVRERTSPLTKRGLPCKLRAQVRNFRIITNSEVML